MYHVAARRHTQHPDGEPVNAGKPTPVAAKAAAIDAAQARPLTWKTVVRRALAVAVAGVAIYLVLPRLMAVLAAWPPIKPPTYLSGHYGKVGGYATGRGRRSA